MTASTSHEAQLRRDGWTFADGLIDDATFAALQAEVGAVLDAAGVRRDLTIPTTGDSPRRYTLASRAALSHGTIVPALYRDPHVRARLSALAGESLVAVPYEPEEFVATRMQYAGDTHGWHWDDYAFALVIVLHAPSAGGAVETIPGTVWDKRDPQVDTYVRERAIARCTPCAGQAYLIRADTTLHRVAPLERDDLREVLTFSYARAADPRMADAHETLDALIGA
jgi:hypothetical protein